jgi:protein-arginine kinase activator protein McsA
MKCERCTSPKADTLFLKRVNGSIKNKFYLCKSCLQEDWLYGEGVFGEES